MGDDVLSSGPDEPARMPKVIVVLAALLALVAAFQGVRELTDGSGSPERGRPSPSPPATAATDPPRLDISTGLHVLAGGRELARIDVDSGDTVTLDGIAPWQRGGEVRALLSRPAGQVALVRTDTDRAWLLPASGAAAVPLGAAAGIAPVGRDAVALTTASPAGVTVRTYRLSRSPAGGPPVRLPAGATVVAGSRSAFLVEVAEQGGPAALQWRDAGTGRLVRTLARPGHALTSDGRQVAWLRPGCGSQCLVRLTDLVAGGDEVIAVLDGERVSAAAFAPDGRLAIAGAFRLAQMAEREPALVVSGAFPFVIRTVALASVPTALAWSANGRWAFLTDPGHGGLMAWARADSTLYRVPVPAGRLRGTAFLTVLPG